MTPLSEWTLTDWLVALFWVEICITSGAMHVLVACAFTVESAWYKSWKCNRAIREQERRRREAQIERERQEFMHQMDRIFLGDE